jgi:hypothetical protein
MDYKVSLSKDYKFIEVQYTIDITEQELHPVWPFWLAIDSTDNVANYASEQPSDHTFCHTFEELYEYTTKETISRLVIPADSSEHGTYVQGYKYTVQIPITITGITNGIFIVSLSDYDALDPTISWRYQILFDEPMLYCMRYKLMEQLCIPCEDVKQYRSLELFMFRELMFRDAVALGKVNDMVKWFNELTRIVGLNTVTSCTTCTGNSCSIC